MSNFASGYMKYVSHLEQINEGALSRPEKMIEEVEESYHDHLRNIARNVYQHHASVRVLMLSGPSSSGKTTTAHLLRSYLAEFGIRCVTISLDDFYLENKQIPLLPNGKRDFESVEALDAGKIRECLKGAIETGRFSVPVFNFSKGRAEEQEREYSIGDRDLLIVEGIHGLNPIFTKDFSAEFCVKLYVSVKQQIKDANGEVVSPSDMRLVRRIVRDVKFRNTSPSATIAMWPEVEAGETKFIRPYRLSADYTVNSIHIYEPCVLRTVAIPMLREIAEDDPSYRKARDLESRLMRFEPISQELVPENSMLREFLG